jgi:hypothetical protein
MPVSPPYASLYSAKTVTVPAVTSSVLFQYRRDDTLTACLVDLRDAALSHS